MFSLIRQFLPLLDDALRASPIKKEFFFSCLEEKLEAEKNYEKIKVWISIFLRLRKKHRNILTI